MDLTTVKQTILVADDDGFIRAIVRTFLERANYEVLTAGDGMEGLSIFQRHRESIALLLSDVMMPKMNGLQLATAVRAERPQLPVLLISGNMPHADCGWGCVAKPFTSDQLVNRVRQVLAEKEPRRTSLSAARRVEQLDEPLSPLTNREQEVLQLICQGYSSKAIGYRLGISLRTASCHRTRILEKAGVHETSSLVRFAARAGFIEA